MSNANLPALLDVRQVAELLHCSVKHVYRLSEEGLMPPPVRLGTLVRWARVTLEAWIQEGCHGVGLVIDSEISR